MKTVTVATKNPGKGKRGPRVDAARYDAMKTALLAVIPKAGDGSSPRPSVVVEE